MFYGTNASFGGSPVNSAASFGGAPASYSPQSQASFGGSPVGTAPGGASFGGTATQMDPTAYMRSLDWSPQNAGNATRQMQQAMSQNGWSLDQMGQGLGFTGQQMQDHVNRYSGSPTGAQQSQYGAMGGLGGGQMFAGGSAGVNPMTGQSGVDMGQFLRGLDWSPQNAQNATRQMTQAMAQNGWTSDQVGQNLGFTGQQMDAHIAKYGAPNTGGQYSGAGGPGMSGYGSMPQNPYLPGIAGDITRRVTDTMNAGIRNARGGAIMAGGFGGSAQGIMEGKAISGASDNLAGQLAGLYGGAWNQDQSRDLQRYGLDMNFYGQQRGQDLQQAGLGASLLQNGMNMDWLPVQNASGLYSGYTGLGSVTTPGSGGGWQGAIGGGLGAAQFAKNMGWF